MPRISTPQVLAAACALFARRGLHQVTIADVTQAAGVGTGTLYRRLRAKPELISWTADHARAELWSLLPVHALPGDSLHAVLERLWRAVSARALAKPTLFAYWVLLEATPGCGLAAVGEPRLPLFREAGQLLAQALSVPAAQGELLGVLFEAQWVAAVQYVLRLEQPAADTQTQLLSLAFTSWWAGLGLEREVCLSGQATPAA